MCGRGTGVLRFGTTIERRFMYRLTDKKIVITGAASGIGRAAARLMVAEGARVLIADLDEDAAAAVWSPPGWRYRT
jgi:NADPH:quinone reductase-like Zn-dependent oxidoreductase